jgi:hypothetical protein
MDIKQIKNIVKQVVRENKQSVLLETPPPSRQEHVKKYWQVLTEAGLSRVMGKYFEIGFMVISADRTCEAEKGMPCSDEEIRSQEQKNKKNESAIKGDLSAAGFGYIPTFGGFRETVVDSETGEERLIDSPSAELSFVVPAQRGSKPSSDDAQVLRELGIKLSKKYNQDSFLLKPPASEDNKSYFIKQDGSVDWSFEGSTANDMEQVYFTQLRKKPGRFSLTENQGDQKREFILFIPPSPSHPQEARKRRGEIFFKVKK